VIQTPTAWMNSPAEIDAAWPTTGTIALSTGLYLQDGETAVLVVERHALHRADERFPVLSFRRVGQACETSPARCSDYD